MDAHLTAAERNGGNRRNGKMQKQVQPPLGEVNVSTPRDRNSSFDPQFIKKRETVLAESVSDRIIGLYALGMYIAHSEGVIWGLLVLTDLQNRGLKIS